MQVVPLVLPVVYSEPVRGGHRYFLSTVETTVRVLEADEAPVAVKWFWDPLRPHKTIDYHCFDGGLWSRDTSNRIGVSIVDDIWPDGRDAPASAWERYAEVLPRLCPVRNHPLRHRGKGDVSRDKPLEFVEFATDNEAYRLAASRMLDVARKAVVVGNSLLVPSSGPVLVLSDYQRGLGVNRLDLKIAHNGWHARSLRGQVYARSAIDMDESMAEIMREVDEVQVQGDRPHVLFREGYFIDLDTPRAEALAWDMVWTLRQVRLGEAPIDLVKAMMDLRNALVERWPGMEHDFNPHFISSANPHVNRETMPPPSVAMLEAMDAVMAHAGPHLDVLSKKAWFSAWRRVDKAFGSPAMTEDDAESMTALDL